MSTDLKDQMTEHELAEELKGCLLVLTTSSPDKRKIYRQMFSAHDLDVNGKAGLDLFFTDSGSLGIPPIKTPEQSGDYFGNLREKAELQLANLRSMETQNKVRSRLAPAGKHKGAERNQLDPNAIRILGLTEDSGWALKFEDKETERRFIDTIVRDLKPKLRQQDYWLLAKLHDKGFPGPNLKPIQEHLQGGFNELMNMIYDAAGEMKLQKLRYENTASISIASSRLNKYFIKSFVNEGTMLTRQEYEDRLLRSRSGEAINSDFVHVPDGQPANHALTMEQLIKDGLYTTSSRTLPGNNTRRDVTEYLQGLIGKRATTELEKSHKVHVAFVTPEPRGNTASAVSVSEAIPKGYALAELPSHEELLNFRRAKAFDAADVLVLMPSPIQAKDNHLYPDRNLGLVLDHVVTAETDPESMAVPIILYNKSGLFDGALKLMTDAFAQGRLMGDTPFLVATDDAQLRAHLEEIKQLKQRAPVIRKRSMTDAVSGYKDRLPETVKPDGVFSVFVGGGHNNNSRRDLEDAHDFGYFCAQKDWRIVSGAGSIEGSMGAIHTGFIQYHLDSLKDKTGEKAKDARTMLRDYLAPQTGRYNAEELILQRPALIEKLADRGIIPRKMFYGYSMAPLLKMENPSGSPPPGITYFESGNRARRLNGLLAPGTKIFFPGSIGTDEELEESIKQHVDARLNKDKTVPSKQTAFADGTPDDGGAIIIYNRKGHLDKLLVNYGLLGNDPITKAKRKAHNIHVVDSLAELKDVVVTRAKQADEGWLSYLRKQPGPAAKGGRV